MKKPIYLLLLAVTAIFFSCKDNSEFAEQLFTNVQISSALKQCIKITVDSTANALCIVDTTKHDGYYYHADSTYRLTLLPAAKTVVDTLIAHGYKNQIDTLIFNMNRSAEKCGNKIVQFWESIIKEMAFPNPNKLLHGGNNAITDYVKATKQSEFVAILISSILKEQFDVLNVNTSWNALQQTYFGITENYSSVDILNLTAQQMATGFFKKMAIVENAIRKDPNLRGDKNGWLYQVFATL